MESKIVKVVSDPRPLRDWRNHEEVGYGVDTEESYYTSYSEVLEIGGIVDASMRHGTSYKLHWALDSDGDIRMQEYRYYQHGVLQGPQYYWHSPKHDRDGFGMELSMVVFTEAHKQMESFELNEAGNLSEFRDRPDTCGKGNRHVKEFNNNGYLSREVSQIDDNWYRTSVFSRGRVYGVQERNTEKGTSVNAYFRNGQLHQLQSIGSTFYNFNPQVTRRPGLIGSSDNDGYRIVYDRGLGTYMIEFINKGKNVTDEVLQQVVDPFAITPDEEGMLSMFYGSTFFVSMTDLITTELQKIKAKGNYEFVFPDSVS